MENSGTSGEAAAGDGFGYLRLGTKYLHSKVLLKAPGLPQLIRCHGCQGRTDDRESLSRQGRAITGRACSDLRRVFFS